MTSLHRGRLAVAWLTLAACALSAPALGQGANPLDPAPGPGANPLDQTEPPPARRMVVPDFIKPGATFIYDAGSSSQADGQPRASAATGRDRWEVLAVTDRAVHIRASSYLPARNGKGYTFVGGRTFSISATDAGNGTGLWMDKTALAAMQSDDQLTVVEGPMRIGGRDYEVRSLTRLVDDSAARHVFDRGTGLLLARQFSSGRMRPGSNDPFMRQNTSTMSFVAFGRVDLPWADAPAPDWARQVKHLRYRGSFTLGGVGPAVSTPVEGVVDFAERGESWAAGNVTVQFQGQHAEKASVVTGPGSVGPYWIAPEALGKLKPGLIARYAAIGATVSYDVADGPAGRVGVLTESNESGSYRLTWAYSLEDGALVSTSQENAEMGSRLEFNLAGRE